MLHGADALTHPAFVAVRLAALRRAAYSVATLPGCVRRALRVQAGGWERRMKVRPRGGRGPAASYLINHVFYGRRAA
jgi:hypothetical protein